MSKRSVNSSIRNISPLLFMLVLSLLPINISLVDNQIAKHDNMDLQNSISHSMNYSTYFGGYEMDMGYDIKTASNGDMFIVGYTRSSDFPIVNAYNSTYGGYPGFDVFVSKFTTDGSLLWSTYLGGSDYDNGLSLDISLDGCCYITGWTESTNFPMINSYNSTKGGFADVFVAKLNTDGELLWSTYLGGRYSDISKDIAVANDGSCFITGFTSSGNFPILNGFSEEHSSELFPDIFVSKLSSDGDLIWSTFLGGDYKDFGEAIDVTSDNGCVITGYTNSEEFTSTNGYDYSLSGIYDIFIAKFSNNGFLDWSSFIGGSFQNHARGIEVASDDSCYVIGSTNSFDFPMLSAFNSTYGGISDACVAKFSSSGSLLWSTFLGGSRDDDARDISVAKNDDIYITGYTDSANYPCLNAYNKTYGNLVDTFISHISANGNLLWSSYIGGSEKDRAFSISASSSDHFYITGSTESGNFPTINAYNSTYGGLQDAFIVCFNKSIISNNLPISCFMFIIIIPIFVYVKRKMKKDNELFF